MNKRYTFFIIGKIIKFEALMLLPPLIVSFIYRDGGHIAILITMAVSLLLGYALTLTCKTENKLIFSKEGFVITAFSWLLISAIGALPFVICGDIPSYVNAFFETVSGFTTTGASILTDVEAMRPSKLFRRSFTHWIGGMGVLVFVMAIIPSLCDRSIYIMKAEMPGPIVGKLVPKVRSTATILYLIYVGMTVIQVILLLCGGMSLFDSLIHTFGTAGTGGFGIKADSIGSYSSYLQWVITVFMILFGINFNLYYLILIKKAKVALSSGELWCYLGIVFASTAIITANVFPIYGGFLDSLKHSAFQVASIITTTGYSTTDFNLWPSFSKTVLILLMFVGGCAGSTGGGLKVSRVMILFKQMWREIIKTVHPRARKAMRHEGKVLEGSTLHGATSYFALFAASFACVFLLISLDSFDFETNFTAVAACINNIGPGFGLVGPMGSFDCFSDLSTFVLSIAMLIGRLEIYPFLIAIMPGTWRNK